jgi:hypothetical protein
VPTNGVEIWRFPQRVFLGEAGKQSATANKKPLLVRFDAETMQRIAKAANRLNISRSAFVASSMVREMERLESGEQ